MTPSEHTLRYARQIVLSEVGARGQAAWSAASADAGDLVEALYLAAAGVGHLRVADEAIATRVRALNPLIDVSVGSARQVRTVEESALAALTTLTERLPAS